jgi:hypothetical protein
MEANALSASAMVRDVSAGRLGFVFQVGRYRMKAVP